MTAFSRRQILATAGTTVPLLATPAADSLADRTRKSASRIVQVTDFGAVGDGIADDTEALQAALNATFNGANSGFIHIPPGAYRVTRPLVVRLRDKAHSVHRSGILGHGARLESAIDDGQPVLFIESRATVRFVLIEGLQIQGNGQEGHGLQIECQKRGAYFYNFCLRDIVVQGCGGDGCRLVGNVFEGQIVNSYFRDNGANGATFSHGGNDTVLSAVHVMGCVFGGNGKHGAELQKNAADLSFHGCYFLLNNKYGLSARFGCVLLSHCGFENNHERADSFESGGAGLELMVFGTLIGCTSYSIRHQTHLIRAYISNDLTMIGCTGDGGGKAKGSELATLDGTPDATISIIGCRGGVERNPRVQSVVLGRQADKAAYSDQWNGANPLNVGAYRLWVDAKGNLRIKHGRPTSDGDGKVVGL